MKPYLQVTMPDGITYEIDSMAIVFNRAKAMYETHPNEFSSLPQAIKDSIEVFAADEDQIFDWAKNNMNWNDVAIGARMVSKTVQDPQEGWMNGVMSMQDKRVDIQDLSGPALAQAPLEVVFNKMGQSNSNFSVLAITDANKVPVAGMAFFTGPETVARYFNALEELTKQIAAEKQPQPANSDDVSDTNGPAGLEPAPQIH